MASWRTLLIVLNVAWSAAMAAATAADIISGDHAWSKVVGNPQELAHEMRPKFVSPRAQLAALANAAKVVAGDVAELFARDAVILASRRDVSKAAEEGSVNATRKTSDVGGDAATAKVAFARQAAMKAAAQLRKDRAVLHHLLEHEVASLNVTVPARTWQSFADVIERRSKEAVGVATSGTRPFREPAWASKSIFARGATLHPAAAPFDTSSDGILHADAKEAPTVSTVGSLRRRSGSVVSSRQGNADVSGGGGEAKSTITGAATAAAVAIVSVGCAISMAFAGLAAWTAEKPEVETAKAVSSAPTEMATVASFASASTAAALRRPQESPSSLFHILHARNAVE